ncbi:MAG: fumarylacetoacetate hydrolase family protein [Acidimicrobiia bacterium]|nr:fumarylacetoacetate hydrolase family protein [Acidimicrobiia bacterium]
MTDVVGFADRLEKAVTANRAIKPLTNDDPGLTVDAAYDIQDEVLRRALDRGERIACAKLGLTSRAKQQQMKVDEPLYGWLTDMQQIHLGDPLVAGELIQPRVEPEIAFAIGSELSGRIGVHDVLAATEAVMPAIDVLDSRFTGYSFTLADVTADNASGARFSVGGTRVPVHGMDLRTVGCVLEKNGRLVDTAAGAAVLGHPANAIAWFVAKLAERDKTLPAGSVVLAGALTAAIPVAPGDVVTATIDRIGTIELAIR